MKFTDAFKIEDHILKLPGLYTLWTIIFIANLTSLFVDDTTGSVRDFNILVNGLSVIYPAAASLNNIYGHNIEVEFLHKLKGDITNKLNQSLHCSLHKYTFYETTLYLD